MAPSALGLFEIINIRLLFHVTVIYTSWPLMVMCVPEHGANCWRHKGSGGCSLHVNHREDKTAHTVRLALLSETQPPACRDGRQKGTNAMPVTSP